MKINIQSDRGTLRLRWIFEGKRYSVSLGMQDSVLTRAIAKQRAALIEQDVCTGRFDKTLVRYKPKVLGQTPTELSCPQLFERFIASRCNDLQAGSLAKYQGCLASVKQYLPRNAWEVTVRDADNFRCALMERLSSTTARAYLQMVSACFAWAMGKFHVPTENPFRGQAAKVRSRASPKAQPFSEQEIRLILDGFKMDKYYSHYHPVVRFIFALGCRPGEAFGLKWQHVSEDCRTVTFCEGASKGKPRDRTKTGTARVVKLPESISAMLHEMNRFSSLVFPSPRGQIINDHTFRRRAWKSILARVGVPYKSPYKMCHSVASHAISRGVGHVELSEQLGHNPRILYDHYVSAVNRPIVFKEFQ